MRILLLNPPGTQTYLRDYYCSTVSKSRYYYHPVDLLYLSGTLSTEHDVDMLDALANRLAPERALAEIVRRHPDAVVALVGGPSFHEDHAFLTGLKRRLPAVRIVVTGDVCRELAESALDEMPYAEATLTDFSTDDLLRYLRHPSGAPIENMAYRDGDAIRYGGEKHGRGTFTIPAPRTQIFRDTGYSFPFVRRRPFMTVLSDFGCPYSCSFCPISSLGFKMRPVDEVVEELSRLWADGYREFHFRDQTFAVNRKRTLDLCASIGARLPKASWSCFSRVDVLDEDRVEAMRRSGCHTVILGIEFDDDEMQRVMKKNIRTSQMFEAVSRCHRYGLRVAGTLILGLPEQDAASILRTGALARALDLDFASFNLAAPRLGTPWRGQLIREGKVDPSRWAADGVGVTTAWTRPAVDGRMLNRLRRRVEREFYLRPSYLTRRLLGIRTAAEAWALASNGLSFLGRRLFGRSGT